ncbi:putative Ribosome biogenesis protein tsr1 like protein [Venustampulla echinocandica]|uniref:Putative Ribosome biogenesis protein tsr1 like protein n=1 Tax=Venustampulla echinocandica TaxID=2656787 RepID=A0A370TXQ7_9HELO|nr:putative Ribosome biogenesis protein tsr1 like protein [Venustampulla echinocandica]RDL40301.1 putative Ribosome biogenesis protein tsr1 like protein [Venustampulla echinocandica]
MPSSLGSHSHRSTTKSSQKPFKSRKATKGALKEIQKGKVQDLSHRKSPHQQLMSKFDRRNQARQKQQTKHKEHLRDNSVFAGRDGAARIVAVIPLCEDVDTAAAVRLLNDSVDIDIEIPEQGSVQVDIDRFKQKVRYVGLKRDLIACMDAARVSDFVMFILSPDQEVDELGELIIRSVEGQGMSTLVTAVVGLGKIEPPKKRAQVLSSLKSYVTHFHPDQEKLHNLDSRQECANLVRSLCTTTPKGIHWRDDRSWVLIDNVQWPEDLEGNVVLTGVVRGKGLKADRLVQVGDWGDFQIEKITAAPSDSKKRRPDGMAVDDSEKILDTPTEDQDDTAELAPEEVVMKDDMDGMDMSVTTAEKRGVLLDDHHYFSDDETHLPAVPKRLPKGTSAYQAAWFLGDDFSDSGSDYEDVNDQNDVDMDTPALPQDGAEGVAPREPTEMAPSEYPQSEMFLDPNPDDEAEAEQLAAFRQRKGDEAEEDREFPDEIELHPHVLARERLARYRGLKSLRTSHWEEDEDKAHEPEEWRRLLQVPNYKAARSQVAREALVGGVAPGTRVHVYLRNVPASIRSTYDPSRPLTLVSLLRHERKRAVVNFNLTLSSDFPEPIKSKDELVMQCGPRRFIIKPIFSEGGNTSNDVHKFDRFLHPGRSAIATFVAPITWGFVPALFFKPTTDGNPQAPLNLIATGTSLAPSSTRVVAKRIIVTGHPYKIHKKLVTIRYMFFNREDVEWFKALQLWTKRGRSGHIKESLGTHGYFKATFDGKINPQDSVGVSLYKRVWPRIAEPWNSAHSHGAEDVVMDTDKDVGGGDMVL